MGACALVQPIDVFICIVTVRQRYLPLHTRPFLFLFVHVFLFLWLWRSAWRGAATVQAFICVCVCVYKVLCVSAVCHHWVSVFVGVFFISTLSSAAASLFIKLQRGGATRLARASISAPVFYTFLIFLSWSFFLHAEPLLFLYGHVNVCVCMSAPSKRSLITTCWGAGSFFGEREKDAGNNSKIYETHTPLYLLVLGTRNKNEYIYIYIYIRIWVCVCVCKRFGYEKGFMAHLGLNVYRCRSITFILLKNHFLILQHIYILMWR